MNYVSFQSLGLPDIKVNDFIKVNKQHWLVSLIVNPETEECKLLCFRDGKKQIFNIKEVENVVQQ